MNPVILHAITFLFPSAASPCRNVTGRPAESSLKYRRYRDREACPNDALGKRARAPLIAPRSFARPPDRRVVHQGKPLAVEEFEGVASGLVQERAGPLDRFVARGQGLVPGK
jgi:hypothetical protein